MAKNPDNPDEGSEFNKIDLTAFEDFSFGTQWTEASGPPKGGDTERRHDRRREGGPQHKDRRPPRRFPAREQGGPPSDRPARQSEGHYQDRGPDRRGAPRRPDRDQGRQPFRDHQPYVSDIFEVAFYPEEHGFNALVKAMRTSCRTYELFEIARLILEKLERCVAVLRRIAGEDGKHPQMAISVPDGMPFETEEEAVQHALNHHLDKFFDVEEIEVDPPKGSFLVVHRCPVTKELLGPPNYHRYSHIVEKHHAEKVSHIPLERYRSSLESSREEEDIQAWLEKMKKTVRYTSKADVAEETSSFDSLEEARAFLLRTARAKLVKLADGARLDAREIQKIRGTEAERAMEGALERQRRFPLDTANALRGRLRRENFHIFKRGSKGITYACSVRRKPRLPSQIFADSIQALIDYLEANPMAAVATLPEAFLGISVHGAHEGDGDRIENLPDDKKDVLKRMAMDLRWLVSEGYVVEFSDGRLFAAQPAQEPPPKKEQNSATRVEKPKKPRQSKAPERITAANVAGLASNELEPSGEIRSEDNVADEDRGRPEAVPADGGEPPVAGEELEKPVVSEMSVADEVEPEPVAELDSTATEGEAERFDASKTEAPTKTAADSETGPEQTDLDSVPEVGAAAVPEESDVPASEPSPEAAHRDGDPVKKAD